MSLFSSRKHKTLSHAVLAGDLRAVRRMLDQGADPNRCDPGDNRYPIHYAVNRGPEMVQLLVEHGADVNIPARGFMPLAAAEARRYTEVASILRRAGARVRADNDESPLDPRFRLLFEEVRRLIDFCRKAFPTESPQRIADRVEGKVNLEFPKNMPFQEQEKIRKDFRALILKECGVKGDLGAETKPVPSPQEGMDKTGMSEDELTRRFMEHLIQRQGFSEDWREWLTFWTSEPPTQVTTSERDYSAFFSSTVKSTEPNVSKLRASTLQSAAQQKVAALQSPVPTPRHRAKGEGVVGDGRRAKGEGVVGDGRRSKGEGRVGDHRRFAAEDNKENGPSDTEQRGGIDMSLFSSPVPLPQEGAASVGRQPRRDGDSRRRSNARDSGSEPLGGWRGGKRA